MTSKRLSWPNCAAKKKYKTHHTNAWNEMKESQEQCCLLHESVTVKIRDNPPLFFNKCAWKYFHLETSRRHTVHTLQCSVLFHYKNNNIFFSQFFFIKNCLEFWTKTPISKIGVPFHHINWKVKECIIIVYPTFWHFTFLGIQKYSKMIKTTQCAHFWIRSTSFAVSLFEL